VRVVDTPAGVSRAVELQAVIGAQRAGHTFLVARDGQNRQRLFVLEPQDGVLWVGRGEACDICVEWDEAASRCHAELRRTPEGWAIVDDGLSRNGTFVDNQRIAGRRRLHDGEVVRVGNCSLTYRLAGGSAAPTRPAESPVAAPAVTPAQRRVLVALYRPLRDARGPASPASNAEIARELVLSTATVKSHMRALFAVFAVEDLPHNRKRMRLVELALRAGLVSVREQG
jgi:predicted component of type VI protein secretion system